MYRRVGLLVLMLGAVTLCCGKPPPTQCRYQPNGQQLTAYNTANPIDCRNETAPKLNKQDKKCIEKFNTTILPANSLIGTWYDVYNFKNHSNFLPPKYCSRRTFSKVNTTDLYKYKEFYNFTNEPPYSLDSEAVTYKTEYKNKVIGRGVLTGPGSLKYQLVHWSNAGRVKRGFHLQEFRSAGSGLILRQLCAPLAEFWLMSRSRTLTDQQIEAVMVKNPELRNTRRQKFCV